MDRNSEILIIEDETEIQNLLLHVIKSLNIEAHVAANADDGLEILRSKSSNIQLVILDLLIPGISGSELFPTIQKEFPDMKILISSGFVDLGDIETIIEPGKIESLPKPYTIGDLRQIISRLIVN